jgi:hypothetical protein
MVLALSSVVSFSGYVPPHIARDGKVYELSARQIGDPAVVPAYFRACGVDDYSALATVDRYQFALGPAASQSLVCLKSKLPADTAIETKQGWSH